MESGTETRADAIARSIGAMLNPAPVSPDVAATGPAVGPTSDLAAVDVVPLADLSEGHAGDAAGEAGLDQLLSTLMNQLRSTDWLKEHPASGESIFDLPSIAALQRTATPSPESAVRQYFAALQELDLQSLSSLLAENIQSIDPSPGIRTWSGKAAAMSYYGNWISNASRTRITSEFRFDDSDPHRAAHVMTTRVVTRSAESDSADNTGIQSTVIFHVLGGEIVRIYY
jgi:hypothetical protein